jgi:hypothetical protein
MGFATSRAGQSLHRLQINMLLQFGQEGTLIGLLVHNFNCKTTIICGSGWTEFYFPASGKPRSLGTICGGRLPLNFPGNSTVEYSWSAVSEEHQ